MVVVGGPVGWGQSRWRARLTCHLTYLRFTTRGLLRGRRAGLSRRQSSTMAWRQPWSVPSGGKIARRWEGAACDAEGSDEADPVGVDAGVVGGFPHEGAYGEVAAQMSPDLLLDELG